MRTLQPGDRVKLTGKFLRNTGQVTGGEGQSEWTVLACSCGLCAGGRFVAVNARMSDYDAAIDGPDAWRHILAANLYRKGTLTVDNAF